MTREEIESQLTDLRRRRGAAVLDAKAHAKLDAEIDALKAGLAAADDAEAERLRRQREQDAKDAQANVKAKIKRIAELEQRRLQAWADLEKATRAQLEAIGGVISSTESERVLHSDVTPGAVPGTLDHYQTAHRIRGRVGELLYAAKCNFDVPGARGIYAQAALEDWREVERKPMASHMEALSDFDDGESE